MKAQQAQIATMQRAQTSGAIFQADMSSKRRRLIGCIAVVLATVAIVTSASASDSRAPYEQNKPPVEDWWSTSWGKLVRSVDVANPTSYAGRTFRKRFRLPFRLYKYLVDACRQHRVFGGECSATGKPAMPVELKVLGALRTLGRATLHDDVAEISGADAETHRKASRRGFSMLRSRITARSSLFLINSLVRGTTKPSCASILS